MTKKNIGALHLGILVIGIILGYLISMGSSHSLDKDAVMKTLNEKLVSSQVKAELEKVNKIGPVSELELNFNGQKDKLYVSNDGTKFFQKIYDTVEAEKAEKEAAAAREVKNKSDKPEVELFVMSYCPYGTQMEKGFIPAIRALGDKINSKVKFVNYAMHGEKEVNENVLQYCIEKEKTAQYNDYLECFLGSGDSASCLTQTHIKKSDLDSCISDTMKKFDVKKNLDDKSSYLNGRYPLFKIHDDLNKKYGVQGSPTLVINGQKIEGVGRDAQSVLNVICSAFKDKPEECNTVLSSNTPAPGFGGTASKGNNNTADAGCGA